jgi:hypothetical protein
MSDQDPNEPNEKRDWERIAGKVVKTLAIIFAIAGLVVVLVVGLVLGACFLGSRR